MTAVLPTPGPDERDVAPGTPTNVANPKRATVRTVIQSAVADLVVLVPIANGALVALDGFLREQTDVEVPAAVFVAVNGGIVLTKFATAITTRIMAVPGVEAFLRRRIPWLSALAPRR